MDRMDRMDKAIISAANALKNKTWILVNFNL